MSHGARRRNCPGGRHKNSILADAMEAVIGAIYLDGGYEETKNFVLRSFEEILKDAEGGSFFLI